VIAMRRYLVVDDNLAFAENVAEILRDEGNQVSLASSGVQALQLAREARFDAVLTDMRMPSMGGAQLVHELRSVDPGIPALVATAYTGDDDLETARHEGLLAVFSKPIPVRRLLELLGVARRDGLIVIVEDDHAMADNLSEALRSRGLTAVTAGSVLETQRLGPVRPFAAIVDLRVPGGPDGEAMRRLNARFPALPIVVMTAHDCSPPAPPVALFRKPFSTDALVSEIERLYQARETSA